MPDTSPTTPSGGRKPQKPRPQPVRFTDWASI
jgi:hypothetical protein